MSKPDHCQRIAAILGALLISGCGRGDAPQAVTPPPAEVSVIEVTAAAVPVTYQFAGRTAGSREVEVRARVAGILLKQNYVEGGRVQRGQSLFNIDPEPFRAVLARTQAELWSVQARYNQAQRNAERLKPLYEAKAVSQREYDDALFNAQALRAEVQAARARLTNAQLELRYTKVEAPASGIASRALKSEGSLISGPEDLLTTVTQIDPIYVNFGISGDDQLRLRRAADAGELTLPEHNKFNVTVELADGTTYDQTGTLMFTDVRVRQSTGTSDARATLPNPHGVLQPGQFVRVRLSGAVRRNALSVPQRAVLEGPTGKFVYVVNEVSKVEARPVQVGDWSEGHWLIEKGLGLGERVVVEGVMKIGPGALVRISSPAAEQRADSASSANPTPTGKN